ncbi:hypothetical protein APUTEX25_002941, partial [Auxenochlorella protothecoides]
ADDDPVWVKMEPVPSPVPPALPAAHNLLQQTLRMQADSGAMAWDPSVAPAATAPRGPGSTSLNPQQLEFAALLRQAGMTGLTEDDIRHLYTVSEGYALQAASTGQPLPLVGAPPPMVPVHAPGAPGAGTTSASTSASLASGSGGRTPPDAGAPEGGAKRRGVVIQHGADAYHFSREAYRGAGVLLRRLGLLVWQQAVLFPDNAMRMQAVRGDLGVPDAQENQDVGTWRAILQRLCLRPEQLRGIVAAHREFLVQEQEILRQRAEFMAVLREVGPNSERARGKSQTSYVPTMTAALEATQGLMRGIQAEHAASTALLGAILRWLDFPVQKGLLFTLSWPYMPQGNIIGTCAALEIGLSLEEYVSMPLPPLTEDCYAMRAMTGRAELATQGPGSLEELEGGPD